MIEQTNNGPDISPAPPRGPASGANPGVNNRANHPVWDVYDDYRSAMMNVRIQKCCMQGLRRLNYSIEIPLAFAASTTVAGLWFWQSAAGGQAWKYLGAVTALLAVLKPILRIPDKIQDRGENLASLSVIENELEKLVKQISHARKYDDPLFKRYTKILDLKGEHKKKFQTSKYQSVSKRLKRSCAAEVEGLCPGNKFFVPEV
jgi:hypothetical protein